MAPDFSDGPRSDDDAEDTSPRFSRTWLESFKQQLLHGNDAAGEAQETVLPSHVCFRPALRTFEEAQAAADGLRSGVPQIISLAEAPAELAQRLLDFLQGVVYTIQGHQTGISATVFLMTPGSVEIVQGDAPPQGAVSYLFQSE